MIEALAKVAIEQLRSFEALGTAQPPDLGSIIQQLAQQFTSIMSSILTTIDSTIMVMARLAYVTVLLLGILLYFTHLEKRLGKDLIKGGIVLAVLAEFVFPLISRL
jgi:hypothetical protein